MQGRGGNGNIYVMSTGNGGVFGDSCAYDGYVNFPEGIAVGSVSQSGSKLYGGEFCTATFVVTFSRDSGSGSTNNYPIVSNHHTM